MSDQVQESAIANAWLVISPIVQSNEFPYAQFSTHLAGERTLYTALNEGDWLVVAAASGDLRCIGRVLRVRSEIGKTIFYFDRWTGTDKGISIEAAGLSLPKSGSITRVQWSAVVAALPKLTGGTVDDIPLIADQAYIRDFSS